MAEEIKAYKTKDGKIFTNKKEAEIYDLTNEVKIELTKMVDLELYNGMDKSTVIDFILENKDKLFSLLSKRVM